MRGGTSPDAFSALPRHIAAGIGAGQYAYRAEDPVQGARLHQSVWEPGWLIQEIDAAETLIKDALLDQSARKSILEIADRIPPIVEHGGLNGWNTYRAKLLIQAVGVAACSSADGAVAREIVLEGSMNGNALPPTGKPKQSVDTLKTITHFLRIYRQDPVLAETITERQVIGFHGTRSGALPSILKYGLLSEREARRHPNIPLYTGERTYSPVNGQFGIHFAQWRSPQSIAHYTQEEPPLSLTSLEEKLEAKERDIASTIERYGKNASYLYNDRNIVADLKAGIALLREKPRSLEARLLRGNYPIAIGTDTTGLPLYDSVYDYNQAHPPLDNELSLSPGVAMSIQSDITDEFLVMGGAKLDRFAVIAVPADRNHEVTALTKWLGIRCKIADLAILTNW